MFVYMHVRSKSKSEQIYMWYPISGPAPIAVHGPISGPKDLYRAVDRYRARSYRGKKLELRFAVVVHGPITVQPEIFKIPRRNVPLGICLSTDFSAFSSFRRGNVRIDISLSTDFRAFSRTNESLARATWHIRTGRSLVSSFFFCLIPCVVFSKREVRRFGEGLLGLKKVTLTERQTWFLNVNLLLSGLGVWVG